MTAQIVAMDNTVADPSVFGGKHALDDFKDKDCLILANNSLSNAVNFYKQAKALGTKPVIALRAVIDLAEYLLIAHNNKGYQALCWGETEGFSEKIFGNENVTAICIDVLDTKAVIKSKLGCLVRAGDPAADIKNSVISSSTELIDAPIANAKELKDFYTLAYLKAIESKSLYVDEIRKNSVNAVTPTDLSPKWDVILASCIDDYHFGNPTPPRFKFTKEVAKELFGGDESFLNSVNDDELLKALCFAGLKERGKDNDERYVKRLEFELSVIKQMRFSGYFLIVWDFINYAKNNHIPVGPGRGSAAGSLAVYCLKITNLDPIPYNLLFERFLNPSRVSFPDIDIDFCQDRREDVIRYVSQKYGSKNVAQVITFGTLSAKAAIKDVARVLNMPLALGDKLSNMIPSTPNIKLNEAYDLAKDSFDELFENDDEAKTVWETALKVEGAKRNTGVHASGLVISNDPIPTRAPLYKVNDIQVVGYEGTILEDVDLVKFDFLGLKTLTVCDNAINAIKKELGKQINLFDLDLQDPRVYEYISLGRTTGMFQIESPGMIDLARRLKPQSFEDLTAMIALYRPGPREAGLLDSFVNRKQGTEDISYFNDQMTPALKPILEPTYGVIVYQEQVIQIVQAIGGFSLGEADLVRRAMGKKKKDEMEIQAKKFVEGAVAKGYDAKDAADLFALIEKFAGYGFNKSHSATYAVITYYTAWLKLYYPTYFMAALLNSELNNVDSLISYIGEARKLGIEVLKPSLSSETSFSVTEDKKISFGLQAIKGVGSKVDNFKDLSDFTDIFEMLRYSQRDLSRDENEIIKLQNKANKDLERCDKHLADTKYKLQNNIAKRQTDRIIEQIEKNRAEIQKLESNKNVLEQELHSLDQRLEELKNTKTGTKISKLVFEALVECGVFDHLGHTRRDLIENAAALLDVSRHGEVNWSGQEFDKQTLLQKEIDRTGIVLTELFSDELIKLIDSFKIPDNHIIAALLGKESKTTRNGKTFLELSLLLHSGEIKKISDFYDRTDNFNVGDICVFELRTNEKGYTNLFRVSNFNPAQYERKTLGVRVVIGQKDVDLSADVIEVYDLDGSLVAILKR